MGFLLRSRRVTIQLNDLLEANIAPPIDELEILEFEDCDIAYSGCVVIVRKIFGDGHAWCDLSNPEAFRLVSVASLSANPNPVLTDTTQIVFANRSEREVLARKADTC